MRKRFLFIPLFPSIALAEDNMMINSEIGEIGFRLPPAIGMSFTPAMNRALWSRCRRAEILLSPVIA